MTQVWDANNKLIPVTVIQITPNVVTQVRTPEVDGYSAIQIAYGQIDPRQANKPATGAFHKAGVTPRNHLTEVRTTDAGRLVRLARVDLAVRDLDRKSTRLN